MPCRESEVSIDRNRNPVDRSRGAWSMIRKFRRMIGTVRGDDRTLRRTSGCVRTTDRLLRTSADRISGTTTGSCRGPIGQPGSTDSELPATEIEIQATTSHSSGRVRAAPGRPRNRPGDLEPRPNHRYPAHNHESRCRYRVLVEGRRGGGVNELAPHSRVRPGPSGLCNPFNVSWRS